MSDRFLDVEDDEQRQHRIGTLLEQLNTTVAHPKPVLTIGRERATGPVEPPTGLLERVRAFLPAIAASNEELSQMAPEVVDIENVLEDEEQYIEMNLGLGVFETIPRRESVDPSSEQDSGTDVDVESDSDSDLSRTGTEEDSESDSSSVDDFSDSDSLSESSTDMKPIFSRFIKPLPRRVAGSKV